MATVNRAEPRWDAASEEHHVSLAAYLDAAGRMDDEAWQRPWAPGKWTPAQVTEHLILTYEVLLRELREGHAMQVRLPPWRQRIIRWVLLPHILFHRTFPLRAPAPREIRPGPPRAAQRASLQSLETLGGEFQDALCDAFRQGGGAVTHPYFGRVDAVRALRFVAVHMDHHRRQVERSAAG